MQARLHLLHGTLSHVSAPTHFVAFARAVLTRDPNLAQRPMHLSTREPPTVRYVLYGAVLAAAGLGSQRKDAYLELRIE